MISRTLGLSLLVCLVTLSACSKTSTEPEQALPEDVVPYHYATVLGVRYYTVESVPPDTCWFDTTSQTTICRADTLIDSVWRVYTDLDGIFWSQSYRAYRHFFRNGSGQIIGTSDSAASSRREGRRGSDTLFYDPSLLQRLLVAPIAPGRTWTVDDSGAVSARVLGEETLPLQIGSTRTWHVDKGAVSQEWYAPGLGRVVYEQVEAGGRRIRAELLWIEQP